MEGSRGRGDVVVTMEWWGGDKLSGDGVRLSEEKGVGRGREGKGKWILLIIVLHLI